MVVPLTGRDRVLGAMSFIYAGSGRRYSQSDLEFALDFARHASMAIENAQAHAALRGVLEFQEGFVAILGHDLRNPLSAIDMGTGLLLQRADSARDGATKRVLERMKSSTRRMSRMIEQILDLSRSRLAGGLEMSLAETDLCATLTGVVDELRAAHPSRTIDLRSPASLVGRWDGDRLEQVFSNLIGNAISYGPAEKPVTVEAREDEGLDGPVHVDVHNEGPPIPEDLQAKIFAPFRRGDRESKGPQTAGLGLGLYISHAIVAAHRGELEVRSSSAEGTTFRVTLPRRPSRLPSR
jgi:signal transduction histidine kinase